MKNQFEQLATDIVNRYQEVLKSTYTSANRLRVLDEMRQELLSLKKTLEALDIRVTEEAVYEKL